MNSFISWIGGKRLLRPAILERFPLEYGRYVEVFGGAGWILFGKEPEPFEVYNDFNSNLTNLFRVVKEQPVAFLEELGFLPLNGREEFEALLAMCRGGDFSVPYEDAEKGLAERWLTPLQYGEYCEMMETKASLGDVRRAVAFYKLIRCSYASGTTSFNSQPENLVQAARTIWQANRRLNENGMKSREALQRAGGSAGRGVIIENRDFQPLIEMYDSEGTFNYLDPPYFGTEKHYEAKFGKEDHYRLHSVLRNIKGKFMVSYNDCGFIRALYKGCHIESVDRLNSISQRYSPGKQFKEVIITNYDPHERRKKQPKQMTLMM